MDSEKVKELASQICREIGEGAHFNYIFDDKLIMGAIIDVASTRVTGGTHNNLIGTPSDIANVFYAYLLVYVVQIREVLEYSSEQAISEICRRLMKESDRLDSMDTVMGFKTKTVYQEGNA